MTVIFNPFLVLRTTFFALLLMIGLLSIAFTAWNINAAVVVGQYAPGSSIFLLFTNCLLIFLIPFATLEYFKPHIRTANVLIECGWVAIIALFQLGGAISTITGGPSLTCQETHDWAICASTSILVPVSWISTFIAFAYFFVLFISVMSHARTYSDIWAFLYHATSQPRMVSWSEYLQGIQSTERHIYVERPDVEKAPWAENISVRRGKDDPYAASMSYSRSGRSTPLSFGPLSHRTGESVSDRSELSLPCATENGQATPATEQVSLPTRLPPLPPKTLSKGSSLGSKLVERLSRDFKKSHQPTLPQIRTTSPFPSGVERSDLPIPLPHKSEWVRADQL